MPDYLYHLAIDAGVKHTIPKRTIIVDVCYSAHEAEEKRREFIKLARSNRLPYHNLHIKRVAA